jgi:hypothetical protein
MSGVQVRQFAISQWLCRLRNVAIFNGTRPNKFVNRDFGFDIRSIVELCGAQCHRSANQRVTRQFTKVKVDYWDFHAAVSRSEERWNFGRGDNSSSDIRPCVTFQNLSRETVRDESLPSVKSYRDESTCENVQRPFIYPIGFGLAWILIVISGWHLKFPQKRILGRRVHSDGDRLSGLYCFAREFAGAILTRWLASLV